MALGALAGASRRRFRRETNRASIGFPSAARWLGRSSFLGAIRSIDNNASPSLPRLLRGGRTRWLAPWSLTRSSWLLASTTRPRRRRVGRVLVSPVARFTFSTRERQTSPRSRQAALHSTRLSHVFKPVAHRFKKLLVELG